MRIRPSFLRTRLLRSLAAIAALLCALAPLANAQTFKTPTEVEQNLRVEDKLGTQAPLDAVFADETGAKHPLSFYFQDGKPKLLLLVYYRCPMLCGITLNSVTTQLKGLDWSIGNQFDVLTISIDPLEKADLAADKKANFLQNYGREGAGPGWHWMTGEEADIKRLADAMGFHFYWNEAQQQYAHPSAMFFLSPKGILTRNLSGVAPTPEIKQALFEAADGKIGTFGDQFFLRCFHFDPSTGKLTVQIMFVVRVMSALLVMTLAALIGGLRYFEIKKARRSAAKSETPAQSSLGQGSPAQSGPAAAHHSGK